jgi:translation initiation factor 1
MAEICPTCGLPKQLCSCEDVALSTQKVTIRTERRRYGKFVTLIEGLDSSSIDISELASKLKAKCAAGGTVDEGNIILIQGNHKQKLIGILAEMGIPVSQ